MKRSYEFMREGYDQWEALKKATDELGILPRNRWDE